MKGGLVTRAAVWCLKTPPGCGCVAVCVRLNMPYTDADPLRLLVRLRCRSDADVARCLVQG